MDPVIQQWIAKLPPHKQELILSLRDVLLNADTGLTERIKWNNLTILRGKQTQWYWTLTVNNPYGIECSPILSCLESFENLVVPLGTLYR